MNVEEVMRKYSAPTTYEREKGLQHQSGWKLVFDAGDVKFYDRSAHDWTKTLLIVFRAGTTDNWCGWMINESQAQSMIKDFPRLYQSMNSSNSATRAGAPVETQGGGFESGQNPDDFYVQEGGIDF